MMATPSSAPSEPQPNTLTVAQYTRRLLGYRPGLFVLSALLWTLMHTMPILIGLIVKWTFDTLSGETVQLFARDLGLWALLALLVVTNLTRMGVFAAAFYAFINYIPRLLGVGGIS